MMMRLNLFRGIMWIVDSKRQISIVKTHLLTLFSQPSGTNFLNESENNLQEHYGETASINQNIIGATGRIAPPAAVALTATRWSV